MNKINKLHLGVTNYVSTAVQQIEVEDSPLCARTVKLALGVHLSHRMPVTMAKTGEQHVSVAC